MYTVLSFVIVLGLLIFVHEFGHFFFAKLFGVKVLKFSLGFGPKVVGKIVGDTEYLISAFPLGGYVKMLGEDPGEEVAAGEEHLSFPAKSLFARFSIVAAGPIFNLLFAVIIYFLIFFLAGEPVVGTRIGDVQPDSAAAAAGLMQNDVILSINGKKTEHWQDVFDGIQKNGRGPVVLTIRRGDELLEINTQPTIKKAKNLFGEDIEMPMLGITASSDVSIEELGPGQALSRSLVKTWEIITLTILGIVKIFQKIVPASSLGGPIFIAQLAGQSLEAGVMSLFSFIALLSVNLGILNLFPIPVLDGGHLVFFAIEGIIHKPLSVKTREVMQQVGIVVLGSLMVFVFYNDIVRLFFNG